MQSLLAAGLAVLGLVGALDAKIGQRVDAGGGTQVDAAAVAAVAAVRAAQRHELLAPETGAAAAAVAGLHLQRGFIDEFHGGTLAQTKTPALGRGFQDGCRRRRASGLLGQHADVHALLGALLLELHVPAHLANRVWSVPTPTFEPARTGVPRWRMMMLPASTCSPPKRLTPRRLEWESRPFGYCRLLFYVP